MEQVWRKAMSHRNGWIQKGHFSNEKVVTCQNEILYWMTPKSKKDVQKKVRGRKIIA